MFSLAVFDGLIEVNPVRQIPRGKLPSTGKKREPRYDRDEVVRLATDERLSWDHRVINALNALTGMRIGEVCGLRWCDYDRRSEPLGTLHVWSQYGDQPLKTASGEATKERFVPVHPALQRVLAQWRIEGFPAVYGRPATDDDFIVPDPRSMGARTESQATKAHRRDAECLGIYEPSRGTHGLRRFFISHSRGGGARKEVLERITHNAEGDIIDRYTSYEWEPLCEALLCLKIDFQTEAARGQLIALPVAANSDFVPKFVPKPGFSPVRPVEAVGIEHLAIHLIQTILERFRGQSSIRTRPKNTRRTRYRTFL